MTAEALGVDQIDQLAAAIAVKLGVPLAERLWTSDDCAQYFGVAVRHFQQRIATVPSFPSAARLPVLKGKMQPRYYAGEVIDWARAHR